MTDRPVVSAPTDETARERCGSTTDVAGHPVRCKLAEGHGDEHAGWIDIEGDPYMYRVTWWPTARREARGDGRPSVGAGT